jgi:Sulfotransferase domain
VNKAIAMWAHPRAVSTAFLRMMIERGDVIVVHEPLVTLVDEGEVPVTDGRGGTLVLRSEGEVLRHLRALTKLGPVFFKNTCEFQYPYLFDHPEEIADMEHTFILRDPAKAIASHYYVKPEVARHEIGYEHLYRLFDLMRRVQGRTPVVIRAESLLETPEATIRAYCGAVGLPFVPEALSWRPEERREWHRTRIWHVDVSRSSGFAAAERVYETRVDNNGKLKSYYDYHLPFYEEMAKHAI